MEVFNTGPEPITLARGQCVGRADNIEGQALTPFEAEVVNAIAEKHFRTTAKRDTKRDDEFARLCKLEVPEEYKARYQALLTKHRNVFSVEKSDYYISCS